VRLKVRVIARLCVSVISPDEGNGAYVIVVSG
jgi:hypothetical protein